MGHRSGAELFVGSDLAPGRNGGTDPVRGVGCRGRPVARGGDLPADPINRRRSGQLHAGLGRDAMAGPARFRPAHGLRTHQRAEGSPCSAGGTNPPEGRSLEPEMVRNRVADENPDPGGSR